MITLLLTNNFWALCAFTLLAIGTFVILIDAVRAKRITSRVNKALTCCLGLIQFILKSILYCSPIVLMFLKYGLSIFIQETSLQNPFPQGMEAVGAACFALFITSIMLLLFPTAQLPDNAEKRIRYLSAPAYRIVQLLVWWVTCSSFLGILLFLL